MRRKVKFPYLMSELIIQGENRADLANLINSSKSALNRRMTGEVDWSLEEVKTISEHYKKPIEVLFRTK